MDIGMSELLVIGIVALIVIGPRDLPEMFRQLGRMTAKMRGMAREFSRAMEQAANESGLNDVAKDLRAMTNPKAMGLNAVKDAVDKFEKWDPVKNAAKPTSVAAKPLMPPPMPATVAPMPATIAPGGVPVAVAPVADPVTPEIGPNTAALYDKQAARAAILAESNRKLKALDEAPEAVAPQALAPDPLASDAVASGAAAFPASAHKTVRAKKLVTDATAGSLADTKPTDAKPGRAPRKKKSAEE